MIPCESSRNATSDNHNYRYPPSSPLSPKYTPSSIRVRFRAIFELARIFGTRARLSSPSPMGTSRVVSTRYKRIDHGKHLQNQPLVERRVSGRVTRFGIEYERDYFIVSNGTGKPKRLNNTAISPLPREPAQPAKTRVEGFGNPRDCLVFLCRPVGFRVYLVRVSQNIIRTRSVASRNMPNTSHIQHRRTARGGEGLVLYGRTGCRPFYEKKEGTARR